VRQYFAENPPRDGYDGNDCICHIVDREFKVTLKDGPLGTVFAQQHKIVAYFKKSNKANNYLREVQERRLKENPSYFQDRAEALGWNAADSWVGLGGGPPSTKPLKYKISMPVRWWSDIDETTRFVLLEECGDEAISRVRKDLKKKGKMDKRDMLKLPDRDKEALRRSVPVLYPIKVCIKELEGTFSFFSCVILWLSLRSGELYPTYPRIVQWLVQTIKDMQAAVERCVEKLNEDAYIAALLHIGIRDTFFSNAQSATYWARLEEIFRYLTFPFIEISVLSVLTVCLLVLREESEMMASPQQSLEPSLKRRRANSRSLPRSFTKKS
jgi:hypothetical protein